MSSDLEAASIVHPDATAVPAPTCTNNPPAQHSPASPSASLHVSNLDPSVTEAMLFEVFSIIGPVTSVRVHRNATSGCPRCFAYINYLNAADAQSALEKLNHSLIKDRPCRIVLSWPDSSLRKNGQCNIYVKNLDEQVDEKALRDAFARFGNVVSCKVGTNEQGRSKEYGFVLYESVEVAEAAINAANGMSLNGKNLHVSRYKSREERQSKLDVEAGTTNVNVGSIRSSVTKEEVEAPFQQINNIPDGIGAAPVGSPAVMVAEGDDDVVTAQPSPKLTAERKLESSYFEATAPSSSNFSSNNKPLAQYSAASPSTSLFVRNLDPSITDAILIETFKTSGPGPVASVHICRDAVTRHPLRYGYVNYQNVADAQRALKELNGYTIMGRPCHITWSQPDSALRKTTEGKIYVCNLDDQIDEKTLYDAFVHFGNVLFCLVGTDEQGQPKGYGIVQYETTEVAQRVINAANGMVLNGKKIYVKHYVPRQERQSKWQELKAQTTNINVENIGSSATKEAEAPLQRFDETLDDIRNVLVGSPIAIVAKEGDNMSDAVQMASAAAAQPSPKPTTKGEPERSHPLSSDASTLSFSKPTAKEEPESSPLASEAVPQSSKLTAKEEPEPSYPSASEAAALSSSKTTTKEEPESSPPISDATIQYSAKPTAKERPNLSSLSTSEAPKDSVPQLQPREAKSELAKDDRIFTPPFAKRFAPERGIPRSAVRSVGPEGRNIGEDVDKHQPPASTTVPAKPTAEYVGTSIPNTRKGVGAGPTQSKQELHQHYLTMEINMDEVLKLREVLNKLLQERDKAVELNVNDFILKAVACALVDVPEANSAWLGDVIRQHNKADISMAVATPTGLVAPIIQDVGSKGLAAISGEAKALAGVAQDSRRIPQEFQGGTFTVSNLGIFGVDHFTAVINPPQSCNLAVGCMKPSIVPCLEEERGFKIVNTMKVTLSSDHRVVDSAVGARWMAAFKGYLENPLTLML